MKQAETLIKSFPDPKPEFYCHIHSLYYTNIFSTSLNQCVIS